MTGYAHVPYLKCARDMPVFPDGDVKAKYIPFQRLAQKRLRSNWHRSRGLERKAHTRNGKFIRWASVQGRANSAGWAKDGIGLRLSGRQARKSRSPLATIACRERTSPGLTTSYTSRKKIYAQSARTSAESPSNSGFVGALRGLSQGSLRSMLFIAHARRE